MSSIFCCNNYALQNVCNSSIFDCPFQMSQSTFVSMKRIYLSSFRTARLLVDDARQSYVDRSSDDNSTAHLLIICQVAKTSTFLVIGVVIMLNSWVAAKIGERTESRSDPKSYRIIIWAFLYLILQ